MIKTLCIISGVMHIIATFNHFNTIPKNGFFLSSIALSIALIFSMIDWKKG